MRNKLILLSILGFLSQASENNFSGYIKSDLKYTHKMREIEYDSKGVRTEDLVKPLSQTINFNLDSGGYLYQGKNLFVFGGVETQTKKEENKKDSKYTNYYVGARVDAPVSDNFDLNILIAHKKGYVINKKLVEKVNGKNKIEKVESKKVLESAVNEHIKVKDRKADLRENGYSLDVDRNNIFSLVLNGRINRKTSLILGAIYTNKDFETGTHEYEAFIKTSGKINHKTFMKTDNTYVVDKENYKELGGVKSEFNFDTKLTSKVNMKNDLVLEVKKIKEINKFEFTSNNEYVNTLVDNLKLTNNLKYNTVVDARKDGSMVHKPEIKLAGEYKVNNTNLKFEVNDKLEVAHTFATKPELTTLKNRFETKIDVQNVESNFGKKLQFKYALNYEKNKDLVHEVLVGPSFWFKGDNENHSLDLRYVAKVEDKLDNSIFIKALNEKKYNFTNTNLDLKLETYNYTNFDTINTVKEKNIFNIFLLNPSLKFVNTASNLKTTLFSELQYYNIYKENNNNLVNSVSAKLNLELRHNTTRKLETVFNLNNTYGYNFLQQEYFKVARDYIKEFGADKFKDKEYTALDNYVKTLDATRQDAYIATLKNVDTVESKINTLHSYRMNPKFSLVIKELHGKLQLIPYVEGVLDFKSYRYNSANYAKELKEKKDAINKAHMGSAERKEKNEIYQAAIKDANANKNFNFRNFEGRIGINIKYSW